MAPPSRRRSALQIRRGAWLRPPYREYRLRGSWSVRDYTDSIAALSNSRRGQYPAWRIHLMRLSDGTVNPVLTRPLDSRSRFEIANAAVSDRWLAWEEVGPGDDLAMPVPWKLYVAPIQSDDLSLGAPFLVAGGHTTTMSRPLIDLDGDRLAWIVNVGDVLKGQARRGELRIVDLARRRPLFAWRAPSGQVVSTVSLQGHRLWTQVLGRDIPRGPRIMMFRLPAGTPQITLDLDAGFGVNHWPAMHGESLAWSAFHSPDNPFPTLYYRAPNGSIQTVADSSSEPTFVGRYLFYERETCGTAEQPGETSEIWAYDASRRTRRPLVLADLERDGQWLLGTNKSRDRRTLVVWGDMWAVTTHDRNFATIRVYRILE